MNIAELLAVAVGILLCAALLSAVLRSQRPELAICLGLAAGALVLVLLLSEIAPLLSAVRRMMQSGGLSAEWLGVVLKAAGVCLLTQLAADTCRDAGETALAGKAELAGRVLLLLLAIPLYERILSLVTQLISGQVVSG